ncbi:MAG: hypothetical protein IJ389_00510 [Clostridia bacterium]|nr:hypothetical protein [Clostridia bacterium]
MTKMSPERIRKRRKRAFAKMLRIITVAPIMAFIAFTVMLVTGGIFQNIYEYLWTLVFMCVLPLTAYPLQKILPPFKDKGRSGQRTLAMIMANVGYILSIVYAMSADISDRLLAVFVTYVLSGASLLIINKAFKFKASGHACGAAGPIGVLVYFLGITPAGIACLILGGALLAAVLWGTVKTHSHTAPQFIIGGIIPIIIFYTLILI